MEHQAYTEGYAMNDKHSNEKKQMVLPEATHQTPGNGKRIVPAVGLLLLADSVSADTEDQSFDTFSVSEPSTLGLLAAGAAVGGIVAYVRSKHRK
jgi:hypothetical protein